MKRFLICLVIVLSVINYRLHRVVNQRLKQSIEIHHIYIVDGNDECELMLMLDDLNGYCK